MTELAEAPDEVREEAQAFANLIAAAGQKGIGYWEGTYAPTGVRYRVEVYEADQREGVMKENVRLNARIRNLEAQLAELKK